MKVLRERVIDYDDRDHQVWMLITDVPKLKSPWQYICFVLNVIIPGDLFKLSKGFRFWNDDSELFLGEVEQDLVHGGSLLAFLGVHPNRLDLFHLLGGSNCEEELGGREGAEELPAGDEHQKR